MSTFDASDAAAAIAAAESLGTMEQTDTPAQTVGLDEHPVQESHEEEVDASEDAQARKGVPVKKERTVGGNRPNASASGGGSRKKRPPAAGEHADHASKRSRKEDGTAADHAHDATAAAPTDRAPTNELTPAVLSVLADLVWTPKFLQTVHSHLSQSRSATPNWHVVSALFRQKLVEGGWAKVTRFLLKTEGRSGRQYMIRSRRVVADFTPPVCERLYQILLSRDRGTEAALELQRAMDAHAALERSVQGTVPFHSGGRVVALPCAPSDVRLEFTGGLPRGVAPLVSPEKRKVESMIVTGSASGFQQSSEQQANAAASSSSSTTTATAPTTTNDDDLSEDESEESFMNNWPGLAQHEHRLFVWSGRMIRKWAKGMQIDLGENNDATATTTSSVADGSALPAPSPGVPISGKEVLLESLHALHHTSQTLLLDRAQVVARKPWLRNGLLVDLSTGEWLTNIGVERAHLAQPQATWSNNDDANLLDAVAQWLQGQEEPIPEDFEHAGSEGSSALLPRTLSHWAAVRRMCQGFIFPCAFYRRRWWLLCQEATEAPEEVQRAAMDAALDNPELPVTLATVVRKVSAVTREITRRMAAYIQRYGEPPKPLVNQVLEREKQIEAEAEVEAAMNIQPGQSAENTNAEQPSQLMDTSTDVPPITATAASSTGTPATAVESSLQAAPTSSTPFRSLQEDPLVDPPQLTNAAPTATPNAPAATDVPMLD